MTFLHPDYLFFMLIPLLILLYLIFTNKSQIDRYYSKEMAEKLKISDGSIGQKGRNIFLFIASVLMVVAFARPVIYKGEVNVKSSTVDILLGIDVSKSMLANDVYPSRLEFAKKRAVDLINSFKKARFGVVAFSSAGFLVSPLSDDTQTVEYLIKNLSTDSINQKGTDLFTPLRLADRILKNDKQKILVLFTDGGDSKDFSKEIEFAEKHHIIVYIYAIGTKKGSTIKVGNSLLSDKNGNIVVVRLNEAIKELALQSGGAYIVGDYSGESIKKLENSIKDRVKETIKREKRIKTYKELFYYPLWGALMLLLFGFSSMPQKNLKRATLFVLMLCTTVSLPLKASMFDFRDLKQAKEQYDSGHYKRAESIYEKLLKSGKRDPQLIYNLANSLYKQKKYKEALRYYKSVKSDEPDLEFDRYFNMGNALANLNKIDEAIDSYKRALKIKDDKDAMYNLKYLEKLKKRKNRDKNKKNKNNHKKNKNSNKNNKKNNKKNKNGSKKSSQNGKSDRNKNGKNKKKDTNKKRDTNSQKREKQKNKQNENKKRKPQKNGKKSEKNSENKKKKQSMKMVNKKIMSDAEEKKWTRMMLENRPKTLPLQIVPKMQNMKDNGDDW